MAVVYWKGRKILGRKKTKDLYQTTLKYTTLKLTIFCIKKKKPQS